jgi:pilus assembly protein CpaB
LAIATDEQRDLSALIQPGNRAISIRAERNDKSFALIRPGDYVDVIGNLPAGEGEKRNAIVLLQRVLVLAVGLQTAPANLVDDKDAYSKDLILTLSVNLQEAQLVSLATDKGELMVALRNPDDPRVVDGIPDMSSTALEDKEIRGKIQKIRSNAPVKLEAQ